MRGVCWRRYQEAFSEVKKLVDDGIIRSESDLNDRLREITRTDPRSSLTHLGVASYLIAFLEYLFAMAEGPYSPSFPIFSRTISIVFSLSRPLITLIDYNAPAAIGNMILNGRGNLRFIIADNLELGEILEWWPRYGLRPLTPVEILDSLLMKNIVREKLHNHDPHLLSRLFEVFPEYTLRFAPPGVNYEEIKRLAETLAPSSVSHRRYRKILTERLKGDLSRIDELIREEESRFLPLETSRNLFLAYLVKTKKNFQCEICHSLGIKQTGSPITVHHIRALSEGGSDIASNMLVVCLDHHNQIHDGTIRIIPGDGMLVITPEESFYH